MNTFMRIIAEFVITFLVLGFLSACKAQDGNSSHSAETKEKHISVMDDKDTLKGIRIVENSIQSSKFRYILVLLVDEELDPANVQRVFKKLASDFPVPTYLTIEIVTNDLQLPPRANGAGIGTGRAAINTNRDLFPRAVYYRRENETYFEYSTSREPGAFKKVQL